MKVASLPRRAQCLGSLREAQKPQSLGWNVLVRGMKLGKKYNSYSRGNTETQCFVFDKCQTLDMAHASAQTSAFNSTCSLVNLIRFFPCLFAHWLWIIAQRIRKDSSVFFNLFIHGDVFAVRALLWL